MTDFVTAWQCIGCGNLEAPQTCIGVCEYRKVRLIDARLFEQQQQELAALRSFIATLVRTHPRRDGFEHSYVALQHKARELLSSLANPGATNVASAGPQVAAVCGP